ncbi:alkaline phosphatase [Rhizobacter sp. Root1221]|uniref:alkaline phosphatase n=1 Tax=Rhizobacter sp. Root1221 TaxID=1736433 RepID=UPI0006F6EF0A|nr:alkaline phosphatase [Rhizobacter sp. Root1221]KQV78301.1 alkaline phosphatase [Rhizobacter sp. Root1221]
MNKLNSLALAISVGLAGAALSTPVLAAGEARNVIFFLGDGMGPVTTTATRIKYVGEEGSLAMDKLRYAARIKTFSKDGQTTDSAPSMAAYMTGVKTRNETLGLDGTTVAVSPGTDAATGVPSSVDKCPTTGNGSASVTLLELAIAKGKATGAVTTARLTHATPAATYAHTCHRNAEYEIARQAVPGGTGYNAALGNGVTVLLGGMSQYWRPYNATTTPRGRPDGRDLVAELQAKGYTAVNDLASLNAAPVAATTKLIGLFDQAAAEGHMSYELDRDATKEPSLAQMATKAVDVLSKNTNGFFLMVEGGRIDHALHGTNAARALADTKAFDDAIQAVIDKVKTFDPDLTNTLIVVTADHDHGMAFNGYGKRGTDILGPNISYATGVASKDVNGVTYGNLVFANGSNRADVRVDVDPTVMAGKNYLQEVAIRRGSPGSETHGGGDVKLHAEGAGAKAFKGTLDNTKVFGLVKTAAGY